MHCSRHTPRHDTEGFDRLWFCKIARTQLIGIIDFHEQWGSHLPHNCVDTGSILSSFCC